MKLTEAERWILSNQYRILEALYPKEASDFESSRLIVQHGYEIMYKDSSDLWDPMPEKDSREVLDILNMFRILRFSYAKLKDTSGIEPDAIRFRGFDGNDESQQYSFAKFFCEYEGGKFTELTEPLHNDLNSHMNVLDTYRSMLAAWMKLPERMSDLSKEEILSIIAARGF